MRTIQKVAIASTIAFSTLAFFQATASTAQAGPIVPLGHYCLSYDLGGTDCSFTSYAQCQATASGLAAVCYGKTVRDDEHDRPWGAGRELSLRSARGDTIPSIAPVRESNLHLARRARPIVRQKHAASRWRRRG